MNTAPREVVLISKATPGGPKFHGASNLRRRLRRDARMISIKSAKQAHAMAGEMVDVMTRILKNGDRVRMSGLGIIEIKDRPAGMGRNPATGATMQIAASKKVAFRATEELKEAV